MKLVSFPFPKYIWRGLSLKKRNASGDGGCGGAGGRGDGGRGEECDGGVGVEMMEEE